MSKLKSNIRSFMDIYENIADSLSIDEYIKIKEALVNKTCHSCNNGCCKIATREKPIDNCVSWQNKSIVGKSKVYKISDINKLNI